jgi:hypothetical protein
MSGHNRCRIAAFALLVGISVAGCSRHADDTTAGSEPATVSDVQGSDGLHRITLTEDGASRIGLATAAIGSTAGKQLSVASAAVLYDENGATWVYLQTAPRTFQRARVAVLRVSGDVAVLRSGPPAGSVVATLGTAELRGAEEGVPGE